MPTRARFSAETRHDGLGEESVTFDTTEGLLIEGDDVLA